VHDCSAVGKLDDDEHEHQSYAIQGQSSKRSISLDGPQANVRADMGDPSSHQGKHRLDDHSGGLASAESKIPSTGAATSNNSQRRTKDGEAPPLRLKTTVLAPSTKSRAMTPTATATPTGADACKALPIPDPSKMLCRTKLAMLTCDFQARRGPSSGTKGSMAVTPIPQPYWITCRLESYTFSQLLNCLHASYPDIRPLPMPVPIPVCTQSVPNEAGLSEGVEIRRLQGDRAPHAARRTRVC
jgi:hypothetical protein